MTTSNINKIIRSNLSIKPWILSKNTSEIVNSYIKKIYKQAPKVDLLQLSKVASSKPENKGPIRSLKTRERSSRTCTVTAPLPTTATPAARLKGCAPATTAIAGNGVEQVLGTVMNQKNKQSAVASLASNRKLLKSPNYKIYGSRRFGSSGSSSSGSIFKRYESHRRHRASTGAELNFLLRSIGTYPISKLANLGLSSAVFKYVTPVRNQHMAAQSISNPVALEMSSAIQRDLMVIDGSLKNRISLGRKRGIKENVEKTADNQKDNDPMKGWHHPPSPDLFFSRTNEQGVAFAELVEQNRRLRTANKTASYNYMRPGFRRTLSSLEKKLSEHQTRIGKNRSPSITRSAHSRFSHVAMPRILEEKSNLATPTVMDKDLLTPKQNEPNLVATSNVAEEVKLPLPMEQKTNNVASSTATSLVAAATFTSPQDSYSFGRFSRSNYNKKY